MNAIGVDVGGTKIAAGVVSPAGKLLDEVRYPTPHSPHTLVETIARAVSDLGDEYGTVVPGAERREHLVPVEQPVGDIL